MNAKRGIYAITLPAQMGSMAAATATEPHLVDLSRLLRKYCRGPYAKSVREFALVFRVDGAIQRFGGDGCNRLRRSMKREYITVDLCVPESRWRGVPPQQLRQFLLELVEQGLQKCVERLNRDKVDVDGEALFSDVSRVRQEFLSFTHVADDRAGEPNHTAP